MKKTYIAPVIKIEHIDTENFCQIVVASKAAVGNTMLDKDRGTRNDADDFDDLW